jgi:hypothetical protein
MMGSAYDADGKCTVPVKWAKHPYGELIAQISHFMDVIPVRPKISSSNQY